MKKLSDVLSASVKHPEHLARVSRIDAECFDNVKSKVKADAAKRGMILGGDYLDRGVLALKQYYAVAMLDPGNGHAISTELDPLWHAHMLFSRDYDHFCHDVVGEYMHHKPLLRGNSAEEDQVRRLYSYTIDRFLELFSEVDPIFWPRKPEDDVICCTHTGFCRSYPELQPFRLYEPNPEYAV